MLILEIVVCDDKIDEPSDRRACYAVEQMRQLAEQGYPYAQHQMDKLYRGGMVVIPDVADAKIRFLKAAAQEVAVSQYALASCFSLIMRRYIPRQRACAGWRRPTKMVVHMPGTGWAKSICEAKSHRKTCQRR